MQNRVDDITRLAIIVEQLREARPASPVVLSATKWSRRATHPTAECGREQVADAADLPFPDGAFDLIVPTFSLHRWDDVAAFAKLARVLRPRGQFCVYDFERAVGHARCGNTHERRPRGAGPAEQAAIVTGVSRDLGAVCLVTNAATLDAVDTIGQLAGSEILL